MPKRYYIDIATASNMVKPDREAKNVQGDGVADDVAY